MINEIINKLKKYTAGKKNTEKIEISVLALNRIIFALEQQPCDDAISRQAVLDCLTASGLKKFDFILDARDKITNLPPVTPQPKMGQWIFVDKAHEHACCSECGYGDVDLMDGKPHNHCQNCGIKMLTANTLVNSKSK